MGGGSDDASGVIGSNLSSTLLGSAVMPPSLPRASPLPPLGGSPIPDTSYPVSGSSEQGISPFMEEELMSVFVSAMSAMVPSSMHEKAAAGMAGDARDDGAACGTGPLPLSSPPSR